MDGTVTTDLGLSIIRGSTATASVNTELYSPQLSVTTHSLIRAADVIAARTSLVHGRPAAVGVYTELSLSQLSATTDLLVGVVEFSGTALREAAIQQRPDDGVFT